MRVSFIKKYLLEVAEAIMWVFVGSMITINIYPITNILKTVIFVAITLIFILGIKFCICFEQQKNKVSHEKASTNTYSSMQNIEQIKEIAIENNNIDSSRIENVLKNSSKENDFVNKKISSVLLIGEQGNELLQWTLEGKTSVVIGKGTDKEPVDIDLAKTAMAQLVSKQHAVLNYTDNGWYVDDIDSKNGTRVKKRNQNALLDIKLVGAVEVEAGDIIYISNTMLRIQ